MTAVRLHEAVIASRPSRLARWQAEQVQSALAARWDQLSIRVEVIATTGDRALDQSLPAIGGKGAFTQELEDALRGGQVDLAVHSLKDLPIEQSPGLRLAAVLMREDPRDVLVSGDGRRLDELPSGAILGTCSPRRQAQILALRPDLQVQSIRGNVETRVRKVRDGMYDATVLAAAGMLRLGLAGLVSEWLTLEQMLPAPGQGALAIQCRAGDSRILQLLQPLHSEPLMRAVQAERAFLAGLGAGCTLPVGALADVSSGEVRLRGLVAAPDGRRVVRVAGRGAEAEELGLRLAREALDQGAREVLNSD